MTMKKTQKYFIFENYYRQIVFTKENSYYALEHQKKNDLLLLTTKLTTTKKNIPDASNDKEYYKSFLKNENQKQLKQSKVITQQPKTIENQNIIDINSFTIEHPKNFS